MKFAHMKLWNLHIGPKAVRTVPGLNPGQWDPERILLTTMASHATQEKRDH